MKKFNQWRLNRKLEKLHADRAAVKAVLDRGDMPWFVVERCTARKGELDELISQTDAKLSKYQ